MDVVLVGSGQPPGQHVALWAGCGGCLAHVGQARKRQVGCGAPVGRKPGCPRPPPTHQTHMFPAAPSPCTRECPLHTVPKALSCRAPDACPSCCRPAGSCSSRHGCCCDRCSRSRTWAPWRARGTPRRVQGRAAAATTTGGQGERRGGGAGQVGGAEGGTIRAPVLNLPSETTPSPSSGPRAAQPPLQSLQRATLAHYCACRCTMRLGTLVPPFPSPPPPHPAARLYWCMPQMRPSLPPLPCLSQHGGGRPWCGHDGVGRQRQHLAPWWLRLAAL